MSQPNKGQGKYSEVNKKVIWGRKCHNGWECCQGCGTTSKRHKGGGLCISCYDKWRAQKARRKAQLKAQHDRWYSRVRGTPEYNKQRLDYFQKWRRTPTGKPKYHAIWYMRNQKLRTKRFLNGGRVMKKYITIICECCGVPVVAPFTAENLEENQLGMRLFREMLAEKHGMSKEKYAALTLKERDLRFSSDV